MKSKLKKYAWGALYGLILTAFTVYVMLDTFVITRVYVPVTPPTSGTATTEWETEESSTWIEVTLPDPSDETGQTPADTTDGGDTAESETVTEVVETETALDPADVPVVITDRSYSDGYMSITITEYREHNTTIYVADVRLSSAQYLKTALAQNAYGKNVTAKTSATAAANNAILAINGDYYGAREKGYVLRNGALYRNTAERGREDLVIYGDGSFEIVEEQNVSAESLLQAGAQQVLSFGPALVTDGRISVTENEEVGQAMADNPRTAIGIVDDLHYVLVVSDGRTSESKGLKLYQLAEFMTSLGVKTAYNLDGGGSSTMVFNGRVINNPTTNGKTIKERSVSDIVYIGY